MAAFMSQIPDEAESSKYYVGFTKGKNSLQDKSLIDNKNLATAKNCEYVVDGVRRRHGSDKVFDDGGGTKVYGSLPFYKKSAGTRQFLRVAKQRLQKLVNGEWTDIGTTSFANAETNMIQARDLVFIYNGSEALRKYDGTNITTYTAIGTPTNLTVTPTYLDVLSVTGITRSSTVATATTASAHNFINGQSVTVAGADQAGYNGTFVIAVKSATTFTYTVDGGTVTPATGTITVKSAGTTTNSYRVSAFNATGETVACVAVNSTSCPAKLDLSATKYVALSWTAVSGAVGYNIYGRTSTGLTECYMATTYETTYKDTGADAPLPQRTPLTQGTTGGIIAKGGKYISGRQYVYGVTEGTTYHPCRMAYSGTLDYIDSFATNDFGGGWVDVSANDGGEIVDLQPYQGGVIIFKTNGVFKFYFNSSGLPAIQEVTRSHGGVSGHGSQAIDNDIVYVGQKENRLAVFTLGQQENYTGDQLRTNEVSIFIKPDLVDAAHAYLTNIASFYFDDKFGFTYTTISDTENSTGFILDTKFGAWAEWDGPPMEQTHYSVYDDGTTVHLYGGSNNSGYMWELFTDDRSDDGAAFTTTIETKHFNAEMFNVEKIWRNPCLWFKYIEGGTITSQVWTDGVIMAGTAVFSSGESSSGAGDLAGTALAGTWISQVSSATPNSDIPMEISRIFMSRSISFTLIDSGINTDWLLMGLNLKFSLLEGKPLPEGNRVQVTE